MNIQDIWKRINLSASRLGPTAPMAETETFSYGEDGHVERHGLLDRLFLALVVILVATLSFGLGRLSVSGREGVTIENDPSLASAITPVRTLATSTQAATGTNSTESEQVIASSKGSKYYYTNCHNTISDKNKITFADAKAAEAAGYSIAANCSHR